jgi:phage protein U
LQKWQKQPIAPVAYYVFDLLWHNESDWTAQPLINRREQLNKIQKSDGRIQIGGYVEEHGIELFRLAKESAQRDWSRRFGIGRGVMDPYGWMGLEELENRWSEIFKKRTNITLA